MTRPTSTLKRWLPLGATGLAVAVGCNVAGPDLDEYFAGAGAGTGGTAGSGTAGTSGNGGAAGSGPGGTSSGGCPHRPPAKPAASNTGSDRTLTYALKDVILDQAGSSWETIGYDFDGLCSAPPNFEVECTAETGKEPESDGKDGIDNAFGHRLMPLLLVAAPDLQTSAQASMEAGRALLVQISGYNGELNDSSVEAFIAATAQAVPGGQTSPGTPKWDGNDTWAVQDASFQGGDLTRPKVKSLDAYVANGTFVMKVPDLAPFAFVGSSGAVEVRLRDGVITGELSSDGQKLNNVILAGRWAVSDLLGAAAKLGLCKGEADYDLLVNLLNSNTDIMANAGTGGPAATCDAFSFAVRLTGYRAKLDGIVASPPIMDQCN